MLREGNSDRRVAGAVKKYATQHPHSMGEWKNDSKSHVAHMEDYDFFSSEQSEVMKNATRVNILFEKKNGEQVTFKEGLELQEGEIIDAAVMSSLDLLNSSRKRSRMLSRKGYYFPFI